MIIEKIDDVMVRYVVGEAWVEFFAAEIIGYEEDETPLYWRKGESNSNNEARTLDEAERYIAGMVKWDGCSHFNFGDENGYLHVCGKSEVDQLATVSQAIHHRCRELLNKLDEDF